MMGKMGAEDGKLSRKHFAVLALCLVVVYTVFLIFAISGVFSHFTAFGVSIVFVLCAFALLVTVAKSRRQT